MWVETKRLTVEQFDEWIQLPENADRDYEFILGEIIEVVSNNYSSQIGILVGGMMAVWVMERGLGYVTGADGGYRVMGERYIPDAALISKAKQPEPSREAYNSLPPALVIEVLSPTNDDEKMRVKIANYLAAGAVVWLFDPDEANAEVYAPGKAVQFIPRDGVIDSGDVLPGFRIMMKDIFPQE